MRQRRSFAHVQRPIGVRGIRFRSKMEANYAAYLEWLLSIGQIAGWKYEPTMFWFTPQCPPLPKRKTKQAWVWTNPAHLGLTGISRGRTTAVLDFSVDWRQKPTERDGRSIVGGYVEVKGYFDARSKTLLDRVRRYFPDMRLDVIDSKQMAALKRQVGGIVPGWIP